MAYEMNYEKPKLDSGRYYHRIDISEHLPIEAKDAGMSLFSFEPGQAPDPVVLYNREGLILHQWPEGHISTLGEVRDMALAFLEK